MGNVRQERAASLKKMTTGSPARLILGFTAPLLLGNLFQQSYYLVNTIVVGKGVGLRALAALGATGGLVNLVTGLAIGMTAGMSIITAQRFGANDMDGARKSFASGIVLSLAVSAVLTAIGIAAVPALLRALRTPAEIFGDAQLYVRVILAGMVTTVFCNLLANTLRAAGDSKTPLMYLAVACVFNILLDLTLVLALGLGVLGAAVSTVGAQLVSGGLCAVHIARKVPELRLSRADFLLDRRELAEHLRIGLPMGFQSSLISIGSICVQYALNGLGPMAIAAFASAEKFDMLTLMALMSFGVAMATYTAQNYGLGEVARIKQGIRYCMLFAVGAAVLSASVNVFAGRWIAAWFAPQNAEVAAMIYTYLVIDAAGFWMLALLFIFRYTLLGLGKSAFPTAASVVELVMRIFAALVLSRWLGFAGVCAANPLAWFGAGIPLGIVSFVILRRLRPRLRAA